MRKPGDRVPVRTFECLKSPGYAVPSESGADVEVLNDVNVVVEIQEGSVSDRVIECEDGGGQEETENQAPCLGKVALGNIVFKDGDYGQGRVCRLGLRRVGRFHRGLARGWLFRRRGGMILMSSAVLALNGKNIFMEKIEDVGGNLRAPLVDFRFVPMTVEAKSGLGEIFGKRQTVSAFTLQDAAYLAPGMHFINAPRGGAAPVGKGEQHFAFLAIIGTVKPGLRSISFGARPFSTGDGYHFVLGLYFIGGIEIIDARAGLADHDLLAVPHFVIGLRPQLRLAAHAFLIANFGQPGAAKLGDALILSQNIFGDAVA